MPEVVAATTRERTKIAERATRTERTKTPERATSKESTTGNERTNGRINAKRKGSRAEHRSIRLLESLGYSCTRAAGSLGAWDVIGVGSTDFVLVQVKSNDPPGPAERESLRNFVAPPNAKKLIHIWKDRQRTPDVRELGV
jgi:hypothetical protein